ncbi:pyruvate dehydrogenase E2 component (dihydrolipoamide acetyltransferase) [Leucobacter luti]|uniref:dihydrolipoamide acetyltransferase family protein n=1 Tax=Leucobacter luti TaxID=340320 RepID=UPI00104746C4|nr:dihydrolipoamide acetyltransferase family protein [Leucobacter luti]MCW2287144.1 pyruvate dehydrogenase E2 component (dihydrolipoamide acetyltransferase) [Leucobacter luti]TCK41370.1 pyruvate dehydrogenase E2 component (dihydrolipoamide acetyltransferase) [Leucobacter luti]
MQTFHLPDLGEGLTEAVLVRWAVAVGDEIVLDQVIAEVETAKSIVDLPTPYAGTVLALHGEEGGTILTGAPVIEVGDGSAAPDTPAAAPHAAEHEAYRAEEQAGSGNVLIGYGTGAGPAKGRRRRAGTAVRQAAPANATPSSAAPEAARPRSDRPVAVRSPIVRRLARELGIDPATVAPSGTDGAVTRADVLRAAENTASQASEPVAPLGAEPSQLTVISSERFSPLRKAVSATLSRSRSEIPEATVWVDVDVTRLWELRPDMAAPGERAPSVTALFARYALLALEQYPLLASRIVGGGTELALFDGVHLGVAVDTERGLMVPVIPRADTLSLAAIDGALRELAATARDGKMPPERLRDSTFTVNNYGGFGVDGSAAIINYPNVAILGIGRILERPWVVEGAIVPRRIAQLSLVFDHRVCDGGYAAGFLRAVVDLLEHPLTAYPRV